eukprot:scaffold12.g8200.t1
MLVAQRQPQQWKRRQLGQRRRDPAPTAVMVMVVGAAAAYILRSPICDGLGFVRGWNKNRDEDAKEMRSAMRLRQRRVRAWRQQLSAEAAAEWARRGSLGAELRDISAPIFDATLEGQLVCHTPEIKGKRGCLRLGAVVHEREMMWIKAATGCWVLMEVLLDSGNNASLTLPSNVATQLGYADQLSFSATIMPSPTMAQLQAHVRQAAAERGILHADVEGTARSWARDELILVPKQVIRQLCDVGVSFVPT